MIEEKKSTSSPDRKHSESLKITAVGIWYILADSVKNYKSNGDVNQAAAMALYSILSALSLFILTIIVAGYFFSSYPNVSESIIDAIRGFNPYLSERLLAPLGHIDKKLHLLGWAGLLGLVGLSSLIFNSIETALNMIFRSRTKRNYFVSKLLAFLMIPAGWIIASVSLIISYAATLLVKQSVEIAEGFNISLGAMSGALLRYAVPYLITVIFFYFIYRFIPTNRIRPYVALVGSALFALLMEIAKQLFTWYITNYTRYHEIFGFLGTIIIIVIWAFYVALIFLFCAELMSSYQRRDILYQERVSRNKGIHK
jgi:membrane protein